jgi:hypothetical protein
MNKKDEEIQRKLDELESVVLKESQPSQKITVEGTNQHALELLQAAKGQNVSLTGSLPVGRTVAQEINFFMGLGLLLTGLLMFFNHVRVGTGFLNMLGLNGGGFGLLLIPLMIGIGWICYDSKNKFSWLLTACSVGVIIFAVLSSLILSFPQTSLLGTVMLLLPLAAGSALLLKSIKNPQPHKEKLITKE